MTSTQSPAAPARVASLLPAATEMVCALGFEARLVGVSHECDFPPSVRGLSVLTRSKLELRSSSEAIDLGARELLRKALSIYDIDVEALRLAAPDVIVTQDLCEVCAVSLEDVIRAAREVLPDARIVNLRPTRLADLWSSLREVAAAVGAPERAEPVVDRLKQRLAAIRARSRKLARRPRVLSIEWTSPVMIGGMWMPELVEIAGGRTLVTKAGDHAPTLTREELHSLKPAPDVVVIKPCGFRLERSLMEFDSLRGLLAGMPWPALTSGDVFLADGNAYFNRPGPRLVESAEILAALVHPFDFKDFGAKHAASFMRVALR